MKSKGKLLARNANGFVDAVIGGVATVWDFPVEYGYAVRWALCCGPLGYERGEPEHRLAHKAAFAEWLHHT